MAYFENFDRPVYADYLGDRFAEQDMERWHNRRSTMDRYAPAREMTRANTVAVTLRDGLTFRWFTVAMPVTLGKRMILLDVEQHVHFYRDTPGQYWTHDANHTIRATRDNYVLTARLPDGRTKSVEYPPESGQVALDRAADLVDWAEREMGVTA